MKKYTRKQLETLYELIKEDQTPDLNEETVEKNEVCPDCKLGGHIMRYTSYVKGCLRCGYVWLDKSSEA